MMNEKMKKVIMYIAMGCTGVTGMEVAMLIATYVIDGMSEELGDHALAMITTFLGTMLLGFIFYHIFEKKDIVHMKMEKRKKVIASQLCIIGCFILAMVVGLVIFAMKKNRVGMIFCGAFILPLLFWEIGCITANKLIKKAAEEEENSKT